MNTKSSKPRGEKHLPPVNIKPFAFAATAEQKPLYERVTATYFVTKKRFHRSTQN